MFDDGLITLLVQRFYAFELEDENRMRVSTGVRFDEANRQAAIAYFERLGIQVRDALARNELERADEWVTALLAREGIAEELDALTMARLQQAVLRVSCDVAGAMKERFEGEFVYEPLDPILSQGGEGASPAAQKIIAPVAKISEPEGNPTLFRERAEELRQKRLRRGTWDKQTALQARKTYALFAELCDDRPLAGYVREDAARFLNLLSDLPANYGKAAKYRGMIASEIVSLSSGQADARLSPRTIQRHLSALSSLWSEAVEAGELPANIFKNFRLPGSKRAQDQRAMWSRGKLEQLFSSPVWRGSHSAQRRSKPGEQIIRDERFWLPLIALFSGMRQEEICQLHTEDVGEESGIWVFDINANPPRQLKNRNAVRRVPLHSELLRLGLLDYVAVLKHVGEMRLFPQLKPGGADERLGHNFTKWFTRYRKDIGLYQPGLDFHSLRHSATTFMAHAGVAIPIIDELTGHVSTGETARYNKGFRIEQLKQAIDALDPEVDLSDLYSAA